MINNYIYELKKKKFIKDLSLFRTTKKYKISVILCIFVFFTIAALTMLFINPFNPNETIINNPKHVIEINLLPIIVGFISGFGLSVASAAMQGITRNPLAGSSTLGFLPVATLGIFVVYALKLNTHTYLFYIFAFLFSLIALLINFLTIKSSNQSSDSSYKIVLVGVVFGALITSLNAILAAYFPSINANVNLWIGSSNINYHFGNYRWEKTLYSLPLILIGFLVIMLNAKKINIIENDTTLAKTLGINIKKIYWIVGVSVILITIAVVNLIGSVVILGIVMVHLSRTILNNKNYLLITPISGIINGTILMFALYINNVYSVGINLYASLIAAPFFIYLIFIKKGKQ